MRRRRYAWDDDGDDDVVEDVHRRRTEGPRKRGEPRRYHWDDDGADDARREEPADREGPAEGSVGEGGVREEGVGEGGAGEAGVREGAIGGSDEEGVTDLDASSDSEWECGETSAHQDFVNEMVFLYLGRVLNAK